MADKKADLAGPGIGNYEELKTILPQGYSSPLTPNVPIFVPIDHCPLSIHPDLQQTSTGTTSHKTVLRILFIILPSQ